MYKVGIFGTGPLAKLHIDTWKEIPGVSIAGFFDPDHKAESELESAFSIHRYETEEALIQDCDLVDIVYHAPARFGLCEKAIRNGKHVFLEKPMAHTMSEAEQLVKLVQESNVKLQVGHMERFNPAFLSLQNLELQPLLIEAHRTVPFPSQGRAVNVVFDLMLHDIDMVLSIVKSEVKHISANGVAVVSDTTDIVNARIAFNNGCVANLTASRIALQPQHQMQLFQKDAYIELDCNSTSAKVIRLQVPGANGLSASGLEIPEGSQVSAARQELEEFVAAVKHNTRTVVNEIDGYRVMEVAHQILQKITPNFSTAS